MLRGYCDSDFAADLDISRSISGFVFTVGGGTINWKSNLQKVVALSTTEAEYMALTEAVKEVVWLKGLMNEMGFLKNLWKCSVTLKVPLHYQRTQCTMREAHRSQVSFYP